MSENRRYSEWDYVPAGTPECTISYSPCCGCGDCCTAEKRINISKNVELGTSVFDNGERINCSFWFWDIRKKRLIDDLELDSEDMGMDYSNFKKLVDGLFALFKPVDVDVSVDCSLDDFGGKLE